MNKYRLFPRKNYKAMYEATSKALASTVVELIKSRDEIAQLKSDLKTAFQTIDEAKAVLSTKYK